MTGRLHIEGELQLPATVELQLLRIIQESLANARKHSGAKVVDVSLRQRDGWVFAEIVDEINDAGGEAFKYCYQCGKCDVVCPWNQVRDFSIRKIIRQATFGLTEIEGDDIWRCTTCGNCPRQCPRGVKIIEAGVSLRRISTEYGVFPAPVSEIVSL